MKRTYLTVPGQSATIQVCGASSIGKTALIGELQGFMHERGLLVSGASGEFKRGLYVESFKIECPTPAQAQAKYLETLDEQQRETLRAHLDALGYELS